MFFATHSNPVNISRFPLFCICLLELPLSAIASRVHRPPFLLQTPRLERVLSIQLHREQLTSGSSGGAAGSPALSLDEALALLANGLSRTSGAGSSSLYGPSQSAAAKCATASLAAQEALAEVCSCSARFDLSYLLTHLFSLSLSKIFNSLFVLYKYSKILICSPSLMYYASLTFNTCIKC